MTKTEIGFTTVESVSRLTEGKVCYQGKIVHNATLSPAATRKTFAEFANLKPSMANLAIDSVCDFIVDQIAQGHRVDFGGFSVGLTMRGGFKAVNSSFDRKKNEIGVVMTPGKAIVDAVRNLKPVNKIAEQPARIHSSEQIKPSIKGIDLLDAEGERRVVTCCSGKLLDLSAEGAGIWVESDTGVKLCVATDVDYEGAIIHYTLSGPIETGSHWIVVCGRIKDAKEFLRLAHRVLVK